MASRCSRSGSRLLARSAGFSCSLRFGGHRMWQIKCSRTRPVHNPWVQVALLRGSCALFCASFARCKTLSGVLSWLSCLLGSWTASLRAPLASKSRAPRFHALLVKCRTVTAFGSWILLPPQFRVWGPRERDCAFRGEFCVPGSSWITLLKPRDVCNVPLSLTVVLH